MFAPRSQPGHKSVCCGILFLQATLRLFALHVSLIDSAHLLHILRSRLAASWWHRPWWHLPLQFGWCRRLISCYSGRGRHDLIFCKQIKPRAQHAVREDHTSYSLQLLINQYFSVHSNAVITVFCHIFYSYRALATNHPVKSTEFLFHFTSFTIEINIILSNTARFNLP